MHFNFTFWYTAPNSQGPIALVKAMGVDNIEICDAYGKTRSEEFIAMNPCHCCPTIESDSGPAIWESNTVMRYICNVSGDKGDKFYPKSDPLKQAQIDMVMDWRQCKLYPALPAIGYIAFGMPQDTEEAKKQFKVLVDEHFKLLLEVYLKDTPFIFSETPTIADLSVALPLVFIMARGKFWDAVPEKVKEYRQRVLDAFPEASEHFQLIEGMCKDCKGEGFDAEP
mgnify:CR=1 FL=1